MSEQPKKTEKSEKKRNVTTLTSMYRAIDELGRVIDDRATAPVIIMQTHPDNPLRFLVTLCKEGLEDPIPLHAVEAGTIEECLSALVDFQRSQLEEEKDRRLKTINDAMSRHQGVVRAARSRVQKK